MTDSAPDTPGGGADRHSFARHPHRTMVGLSVPVMMSLVAEPVTGLIDTAFIVPLGSGPTAALGIGVTVLSTMAWIFNFLGISTQTEVARSAGAGDRHRARELAGLALLMAAVLAVAGAALVWLGMEPITRWMSTDASVQRDATLYSGIRLLGSPASLAMLTAFGALRGLQDMRTPLWIATATYALNAGLDALLIPGAGPIPALGIAGAAWASVASQWIGAVLALIAVRHRIGFPTRIHFADAAQLLVVGRDLFARTALLTAFLWIAQRDATRAGTEAGAAHQAIRQVWLFTALALDAFAATAQSLVGYFLGAQRIDLARRAAAVACLWGLASGVAIAAAMWAGTNAVSTWLVPPEAHVVFVSAWLLSAVAQPMNAICFVTDGIHWGTGDYRYLRNGMIAATGIGVAALWTLDLSSPDALAHIWLITGVWITIRAVFGLLRVWPGIGAAPLRRGS